jgi:hypothetical protein
MVFLCDFSLGDHAMRMLLGCATAMLLAGTSVQADELDRETKGKPATATTAATTAPVAGSELDQESPEQSRHYHWRGGYGHVGYGHGYGSFYRSSYGYGYGGYGYNSFYRPYYGYGYSSYYRPYYGYGYSSFYRPSYGYGFSYRW